MEVESGLGHQRGELVRDDYMSGWAKTGWLVFTIALPFLGVFVYLIARDKGMGRREQEHTRAKLEERDRYILETVGATGPASEADPTRQALGDPVQPWGAHPSARGADEWLGAVACGACPSVRARRGRALAGRDRIGGRAQGRQRPTHL